MTNVIDPFAGAPAIAPVAGPASGAAPSQSPAFRALLESLEKLAHKATQQEPVHDTESLKRAIASADDGFQQAMDLRRRLEDAFQQRTP